MQAYVSCFPDMLDLNLILEFEDKILILAEIVRVIENWLKSSIKESIVFIPAGGFFMARSVHQIL